ncbi:MAG: SRPBCC family protein [Bacteroidota bacterium]
MIYLLIIAAIIVFILVAAALLSEDYTIETDIVINRPRPDVYNYLKFLKNSEHYNKWVMTDPNLRKEYIGTDATVGFVYKWDSDMKEVGQGEQEIKGLNENEKIDYEIRFFKPFKNVCGSSLVTKAVGDAQTNVHFSFYGKRNFPMRIFHFLFNLRKVLQRDLHASLVNLKNVLEK